MTQVDCIEQLRIRPGSLELSILERRSKSATSIRSMALSTELVIDLFCIQRIAFFHIDHQFLVAIQLEDWLPRIE